MEKGKFLLVIFGFIFLMFFVVQVSATTYYVSPSGSDSNSGSMNAPFKTISKGISVAGAGDTVIVGDGVYYGAITFTRSGTAVNPIIFRSANKWGAVLDGQNSVVNGVGFSSYVNNIIIEGFEIKNSLESGIKLNTGNSNLKILKNKIHHIGRVEYS